ncbi:MAG TPA: major capsid protein [Gemmatimonadales bacterium]|nr:major capsid protein [Gemmatimonadales bacterium]
MPFQIPEDLNQFSVSGLQDLAKQAKAEFETLMSTFNADTGTDEELDYLEALQEFHRVTIPETVEKRKDRRDRFSALTEDPAPKTQPTDPDDGDSNGDDGTDDAAVTASSKGDVIKVNLSDIVDRAPEPTMPAAQERPTYSTLVAAAGVPNFDAGQPLTSMLDVAKAFEAKAYSHTPRPQPNGAGEYHKWPVAQLVRDYPAEFSVEGDNTDYAKLLAVADESRLPGGSLLKSAELRRKEIMAAEPGRDSLVAAAGWCAPSETDYSICLQITTDGLADFPEVQARRGGIRHNTGIEFDSIFGGGNCSSPTGFFDLTEAQVAAGTVKTCLEVPCPSFVDTRLGVTGLCLTGNILSIRGYPEFTAAFTRGALAASAHQINREQIADVIADSTAVSLAGGSFATDLSVVSQVFSAVEMAIVDIKYRLRLQQSATLEVIMPFWILSQMRADWIRRNGTGSGPDVLCLADSAISNAFSCRGARVQYVYDWQDAFATCAATGVGSDTPISSLPGSLSFIVYPAGTWVRAVSDVITLNSVYDSTKLATNQVTHLFTETGWAMIRMCPLSRVYTVSICPNGKTGLQRDVTCP